MGVSLEFPIHRIAFADCSKADCSKADCSNADCIFLENVLAAH